MKHLFNKLAAFIVMLMCMSATAQAEIVHHEVCEPTASTRGFTRECWEDTETGKFYSNSTCTQELTRHELAKAVVYAKLPSNPITGSSEFNVVESDNIETWGVNMNWAAETTFSNAYTGWSSTPRYAEFTVEGKNVADARLVWMKNEEKVVNGRYTIKIYVKDAETQISNEVYSFTQTDKFEGVNIHYLQGLKNGDVVKFEVTQIAAATWHEASPTFKACLEYTGTFGHGDLIHHTKCDPTFRTRGFTRECWEDVSYGKFYFDEACTREIAHQDYADVVVYAKLPTNPIIAWSKRFYCEETGTIGILSKIYDQWARDYWEKQFDWLATTNYREDGVEDPTGIVDKRSVEFTVTEKNPKNVQLVWYTNNKGGLIPSFDGSGQNIQDASLDDYDVSVYLNNVIVKKVTTTNRDIFKYLNIIPLTGLNQGDIVKFEVDVKTHKYTGNAYSKFQACLQYTYDCTHEYPEGSAICSKCGEVAEHEHVCPEGSAICSKCGEVTEHEHVYPNGNVACSKCGHVHEHVYPEGSIICSLCGCVAPHDHVFPNGEITCSICGYISERGRDSQHHEACDHATLTQRAFASECWEYVPTGQIYSNVACSNEITNETLAKTVTYAKLPETPIHSLYKFTASDITENDRGVDLNWAAVTTYTDAKSYWDTYPRNAVFKVKDKNISSARLVWSAATRNDYLYGGFEVDIYVNGKRIFKKDKYTNYEGVFVLPLPGLKENDEVKFETWQNTKSLYDVSPTFKASLEYNLSNTVLTANEDPDNESKYYTTFYDSHYAYTLPQGVKAYTATIENNDGEQVVKLNNIEGNILPKGEAVLLYSGVSGEMTLTPTTEAADNVDDNVFCGVDVETTQEAYGTFHYYMLSYGQHQLGFYRMNAETPLAAHKAFLPMPAGPQAKPMRMVFTDDEVTGINQIENGELKIENAAIYNLNGMRMNKLQKGINIVNGKKVIIK